MKDHSSHRGNNRETFDYFEEIDEVLGCKTNNTPKRVYECGLVQDASVVSVAKTGDSEDSLQSSGYANNSSNVLDSRHIAFLHPRFLLP